MVIYGEERLLAAIRRCLASSADEARAAILTDVQAFVGGAPQFDDITALVLKRN
jgi:sigma-B regulation protein RsbU (phosphoserine phosphatase)